MRTQPGQRREAGFTLLEVLVAAMLLVVALVGSIALIMGLAQTNRASRTRDIGYLIAQEALEQISAVPLPILATNNVATAAPSAPTCYGMSDDAVLDHPVPCGVGPAYYLRSWVCCTQNPAALPPYVVLPPGVPITGAQCNVAANNPVLLQLVSPNQVNGGITCLLESEVTWPNEDPVAGFATPAQAPGYFVDPPTPPPVGIPKTLSFNNHVFASLVREQ